MNDASVPERTTRTLELAKLNGLQPPVLLLLQHVKMSAVKVYFGFIRIENANLKLIQLFKYFGKIIQCDWLFPQISFHSFRKPVKFNCILLL